MDASRAIDLSFVCRDPQALLEPIIELPAQSGLYEAMPREEYNNVPALSYSLIKRWMDLESVPHEFKWWLTNRWVETKSDSVTLGSALDEWVLGSPHGFIKKFATIPTDAPRRPTAIQRNAKKPSSETVHAIGYWDQFHELNAGKVILSKEDYACVEAMAASLDASKATGEGSLFKECRKTVAIVLEAFGGLPWKSEFDLWNPSTDTLCDLKVTRDASAPSFGRDCIYYGYDVQACVYLSVAQALGFNKSVFAFITVKREPPFTVRVHRFNLANDKHLRLFKSVSARIEASAKNLLVAAEGDFAEDGDWVDLQLPDWATRQSEVKELLLTG